MADRTAELSHTRKPAELPVAPDRLPAVFPSDPDLDHFEWPASQASTADSGAPLSVAIIGYGYWGPNLARNFVEIPGAALTGVCDSLPERLDLARRRYPAIRLTADPGAIFADPNVDAVVIATPVASHFELALSALRAGKHVLVEKPLCATSTQARRLVQTAKSQQRTLMVGHTFVYNGAVQKIKELVDSGRLGRLYYYDSVRVNLGMFRPDVDVLWDLAVHDLAIMDYLLGIVPAAVSAVGVANVENRPNHTAYLSCFFENNLLAHVHVNWLSPVKVRRTLIGGEAHMIVYDDLEPSEKVKVYDRGVSLQNGDVSAFELQVGYRAGDVWAPRVSLAEALRVEAQHFVDSVRNAKRPLTDGEAGMRIVKILEAAGQSIRQGGDRVAIDWS